MFETKQKSVLFQASFFVALLFGKERDSKIKKHLDNCILTLLKKSCIEVSGARVTHFVNKLYHVESNRKDKG